MNLAIGAKPPVWFWIVSGLALVWNLMGVAMYVRQVTMSAEALAKLPEADQAVLAALPPWYMAVFAIAVFAGALGCLALLLRKKWATLLLVLSFAAVVIQQIYFFALTDIGSQQHGGQLVMTFAIPVVGLLLVLMARSATAKGWLR
ncbi:MAG: hypothetical protein V3V15_08965 [Sphingorhabdus sp.]